MIVLPNTPEFEQTLLFARRPDWQQVASKEEFVSFCALPGSGGLLTPLSWQDTQEFMEGGAWEERMINDLGYSQDELDCL